jgi:predicted Rossmann fold nucleotide-binding protein DprA/Smf involved in DNA uptake
MKDIKKDLQAAKKQLKSIAAKIEKIEKALGKTSVKKPTEKIAPKKSRVKAVKPVVKSSQDSTAIDTVVSLIRRSKNGVDIATIKKKTGFEDKQISNLLYKAKKKGLVKSLGKGVYSKAD